MQTRRGVLAVMGSTVVAGCASTTETSKPPESDEKPTNTLSIPLGGLGKYEEQIRAVSIEDSKFSIEGMQSLLNQDEGIHDERETLVNIVRPENKYEVLRAYYGAKNAADETVVVNQNWSFTSDSELILEFYLVEDGMLQSEPIITDTSHGSLTIHRPGEGPNPRYLRDLRDDSDAAQMVPQDWDAMEAGIKFYDQTEEELKEGRANVLRRWSGGIFGVESDPKVIPYDAESSNVVFDGLYHQTGHTEAVVYLSNQYAASDKTNTDQVVSAHYTGGGWNFEVQSDYKFGNKLPGAQ